MLRSKLLALGVVAGMAVASSANAAPVTQNFNGLAFNGSSGGSWTVIHPSANPMDGSGTILKGLSDSYENDSNFNLNYSITWDDQGTGVDYTDAGALDGGSISFQETDFLFDRYSGVGDFILRLQASTLNINNANIGATGSNATPFGSVDPEYGLTGVLDFVILDLSNNILFDSQFNLPAGGGSGGGVGDLNSGPFNGLGVGTANGPPGDIAMFIWAASAESVNTSTWTDWGTGWDPLLGIDLGMWGQNVPVPAPAGMLLLGFGLMGIAGLRRKA